MRDLLADRFEAHRPRLTAVARRVLGSQADAEDAVQEAWVRLDRSDAAEIRDLEAWLTTTVGRIALNALRSRATRRELPLDRDRAEDHAAPDQPDPALEVVLADTVGAALQVVLDTLTPAERTAYVLHDAFALPFAEVGRILDRSPEAARQLASRGRARLRRRDLDGAEPVPVRAGEQEVVGAFLAASREGRFGALLDLLDPGVVERVTTADRVVEVRGAEAVAGRAREFAQRHVDVRAAWVDGWPGWIAYRGGVCCSVGAVVVEADRIVRLDVVLDPARLAGLRVVSRDPGG